MRIVTFNVYRSAVDTARRQARQRVAMHRLLPDVVALQETWIDDHTDSVRDILPAGYDVIHQRDRAPDGTGISLGTRLPVIARAELAYERGDEFPAGAIAIAVAGPFGCTWIANVNPEWHLGAEAVRCRQAVATARWIDALVADRPGHVIVAGDFDADDQADSIRFWTGHHVVDGCSVAYRDAAASLGHADTETFTSSNPYSADWDWPFRSIDHILVRCGEHGGPTLPIARCERVLSTPDSTASDHYGLLADLTAPPEWPIIR